MSSLKNILAPSTIGWSNPHGPTRLGPLRSCIHAETLRSTRIKYAITCSTISSTTTIVIAEAMRLKCVMSLHPRRIRQPNAQAAEVGRERGEVRHVLRHLASNSGRAHQAGPFHEVEVN